MLEIIALIFLTKEIGKLADKKGLKPITWKIYLVIGWIIAEIIGAVFGILIFGQTNKVSIMLVGIVFAVTAYYLIKYRLENLPGRDIDDDINDVGNN